MIVKHSRSSVLGTIDNEDLGLFFGDAIKAITTFDSLYRLMTDFEEGEADDDEVFDAMDSLLLRLNFIELVADIQPSVVSVYNKYLRNTKITLNMLMDNITRQVEKGLYPSVGDVGLLKMDLKSVIGGLVYFLIEDFGVRKTAYEITQCTDANDVTIDEILSNYVKKNGLDLVQFCTQLLQYHDAYKLRLDFFDDYPELEDDFEKVTGPFYNLIPEGMLTLELVQDVIAGKVAIEDVLEE